MEGNDEWKRQQMLRNRTYFPNANPGSGFRGTYSGTTGPSYYSGARDQGTGFTIPGVAEGQARMAQIANTSTYQSRRAGGSMVTSPQGGQMFVPTGQLQGYLDKGYTNYTPPRTPIQQFDLNQAYAQGYGTPQPSIQQGPGGPYKVAGGVAAPYNPPNAFQRLGSNLSAGLGAMGTFAANLGTQFQNAFMPRQSTQSQNFYAYNPSPVPMKPNRYFDNY